MNIEVNKNIKKMENNLIRNNSEKDNKSQKEKISNVVFHCDECKRIPLLIPSNVDDKMIKFCHEQKNIEVISLINLLNMINIKYTRKKDVPKENIKINDSKVNLEEFICPIHAKEFINYCKDCSKDICYSCSKEHLKHELIYFSQFLPSNKDIREGNKILAEMKKDLEKFKQSTKEIIKTCENLIIVKEILINSLKSIDLKKLNFYSIMNYKNILKIKIKLIEKQYQVINPLSELNSILINYIKRNFESLHNVLNSFDENSKQKNKSNNFSNINFHKNSIQNSYQSFINFLEESYEFKNKKNLNEIQNNNFDKIKSNITHEKISSSENVNVSEYISNLENKNDFFIPLINNIKNQNGELEKENNKTVKEIVLKDTSELNEEKNKIIYMSEYDKSTIIQNQEFKYIINTISSKINKKIKKLYLCYRATEDGDKADDFHEKCDYIKNIIVLISTKNNKKFGGFSSESWDNNDKTWKYDKNTFIFSLDNYKSYDIIKPERALLCLKKFGPIFGNGEILISDNFFSNVSYSLEKNICYESNENFYPLSSEKEFIVSQLEAYKVDFE